MARWPARSQVIDNGSVGHVEPEALRDSERIYLARTLREAQEIEDLLTGAGVDYVVQVEVYARSFLFGTLRHGAAFYVAAAQATHCRARLTDAGHEKGVVEDEPTHESANRR